jgi:NTE family protein
MHTTPLTGLVLSGGGARAAYQVGVLKALSRLRRTAGAARRQGGLGNPFGIICGTSAGAINAAALACQADRFDAAVQALEQVWGQFRAEQVYRSDSLGVIRTGAQWLTMLSIGFVVARWRKARPRSLLDNSPLADLLQQTIRWERLPQLLRHRHLQALAITASGYTRGEHVTFFQSATADLGWQRSQRQARQVQLTHQHLLASSAIPFVFPAAELEMDGHLEWFGDGSMRQSAPLSPAIHLGAQRLLVIGAGRLHEPPSQRAPETGYPNLAQIAGHALSSIFLDALSVDIERLERINRTLSLLPEAARTATHLRPIETLVIAPSQRLDDIAARHLSALPKPVRTLLRGAGVSGQGQEARGASLASYLLFEAPFTQELMALGEADTLARRDEVIAFLSPVEPLSEANAPHIPPTANSVESHAPVLDRTS